MRFVESQSIRKHPPCVRSWMVRGAFFSSLAGGPWLISRVGAHLHVPRNLSRGEFTRGKKGQVCHKREGKEREGRKWLSECCCHAIWVPATNVYAGDFTKSLVFFLFLFLFVSPFPSFSLSSRCIFFSLFSSVVPFFLRNPFIASYKAIVTHWSPAEVRVPGTLFDRNSGKYHSSTLVSFKNHFSSEMFRLMYSNFRWNYDGTNWFSLTILQTISIFNVTVYFVTSRLVIATVNAISCNFIKFYLVIGYIRSFEKFEKDNLKFYRGFGLWSFDISVELGKVSANRRETSDK